jgi:hypothetical protein
MAYLFGLVVADCVEKAAAQKKLLWRKKYYSEFYCLATRLVVWLYAKKLSKILLKSSFG